MKFFDAAGQANGYVLTNDGTGLVTYKHPFLTWTPVKTGAYNIVEGDYVLVDPSGGGFAIDTPATPTEGSLIGVKNVTSEDTLAVTLNLSGSQTAENQGGGGISTTSLALSGAYFGVVWKYSSVGDTWWLVSG